MSQPARELLPCHSLLGSCNSLDINMYVKYANKYKVAQQSGSSRGRGLYSPAYVPIQLEAESNQTRRSSAVRR